MSKFFSFIAFTFFTASIVFAQLDPTFGTNGITQKNISDNDSAVKTFILPDSKILVFQRGTQDNLPDQYQYNLVKFNANGSSDTTYGTNGVMPISISFINKGTKVINDVLLQPDGKLILFGMDNFDGFVTRINENGTLDTTFANGGFHRPNFFNRDDTVSSVTRQTDGKLVVFGTAQDFASYKPFFIRYNLNGSLDTTFGNGDGYVIPANSQNCFYGDVIGIQSTGKYIVKGCGELNRYNSDGAFDNNFFINLTGTLSDWKLTVTEDDKIVAVSSLNTTDPLLRINDDLYVRRYNSNGTTDTTFGSNGSVIVDVTSFQTDSPEAVSVQSDGKIIIAANTTINNNKSYLSGYFLSAVSLNANGAITGKTIITAGGQSVGTVNILSNGNIINVSSRYDSNFRTDLIVTGSIGVPMSTYRLHGIPYNFQPDGNKATFSVFRAVNTRWFLGLTDATGTTFGLSTDILATSDFVGDFRSDLAVFRPSNGTWYIAKPFGDPAQNFLAVPWGSSGDIPAPADYDGDGKSDITVFRPSNGVWYIRNSNDNSARFFQWGTNGDKPVTGDYDGDGFADIAVWRPSTGVWYIYNSSNNQPRYVSFGLSGDIPIQEDYDGDGKTDIGVWRPSTGIWYIIKSSDSNYIISAFGLPTDVSIPADYDGDRKTDIAVWRASQNRWYILNSGNGLLNVVPYGIPTDIPLPAKY